MAYNVLITDEVSEILIKKLIEGGLHVEYRPDIEHNELLDIIGDYDVIVVRSRTKVFRDVISRGKKLKIIARVGVGLDNIDVEYALDKGIKVINAGGATARSVAELTIGLILGLARKIIFGHCEFMSGRWAKKKCKGFELRGKTLGIIGAGNIGHIIGEIAHYGFGMQVLGYRRNLSKIREPLIPANLNELLHQSDIISINLPLTPETKGFVNKQLLSKTKKNVLIVTTSRLEIIDLDALVEYIQNGHIAGFAADSNLKPENPKIKKLLELPNVILTPHIGAQTPEAQKRAAEHIAEKILSILTKS